MASVLGSPKECLIVILMLSGVINTCCAEGGGWDSVVTNGERVFAEVGWRDVGEGSFSGETVEGDGGAGSRGWGARVAGRGSKVPF